VPCSEANAWDGVAAGSGSVAPRGSVPCSRTPGRDQTCGHRVTSGGSRRKVLGEIYFYFFNQWERLYSRLKTDAIITQPEPSRRRSDRRTGSRYYRCSVCRSLNFWDFDNKNCDFQKVFSEINADILSFGEWIRTVGRRNFIHIILQTVLFQINFKVKILFFFV